MRWPADAFLGGSQGHYGGDLGLLVRLELGAQLFPKQFLALMVGQANERRPNNGAANAAACARLSVHVPAPLGRLGLGLLDVAPGEAQAARLCAKPERGAATRQPRLVV